MCDLARELDKNGFDVKFYSFVPAKRTELFGLPRRCSASVFYWMVPFLALEKVVFKHSRWAKVLRIRMQDIITGLIMRKCDVVISMSGDFVYAPRRAKRQGATVIIERGSKHILEQKRILESIPSLKGTEPVPAMNVKRELECYEMADYIAVASQHVVDSFVVHKYDFTKLFKNPYGVDLSMFGCQPNAKKMYDVIMVGGWSYRKGCDLIIEAIRRLGVKFLHVGSIVDMEFPSDQNFTHIDSVNQPELNKYYNQAKVFVLPSREEGLAMVQAQAIACNLPLIGSHNSGAEDLKQMVQNPKYITIINDYTVEAVADAITESLKNYETLGNSVYAGDAIKNLTWEAYGKRYADFINVNIKK